MGNLIVRFNVLGNGHTKHWIVHFLIISLAGSFCCGVFAATESRKMPAVPKWGLFERTFRSSVNYTNPLQDARLRVVFTSPLGERREVEGFWDGGRDWRVRFAPNQSGVWSFKSACSDEDNRGLNQQNGEFVCTAAGQGGRFSKHGPVNVARDRHHLEHADGTPFFWLADTVWNGPRTATAEEWQLYAGVRADQKFTAALWAPAGGEALPKLAAFTRSFGQTVINPQFFQKLDARLDTLGRSGILSGIAPLMDLTAEGLSEDESVALVHYVVARWGAEPVVWVLPLENAASTEQVARIKRIGTAVFSQRPHAPVMLAVKGAAAVPQQMRGERWVDLLGLDGTDGLLTTQENWNNEPERPIIFSTPLENAPMPNGEKRFQSDDVRQSACWHLLVVPTAGVSYRARGVVDWDPTASATAGQGLPMWQRALFMPGAKQMSLAAEFFEAHDFWRLRPLPKLPVAQPDESYRPGLVVAAGTDAKDLVVAYSSAVHSIELSLAGLPLSPTVSWFNPRTGTSSAGVAVVTGGTCQFPIPEPGDWVLVLRSRGK